MFVSAVKHCVNSLNGDNICLQVGKAEWAVTTWQEQNVRTIVLTLNARCLRPGNLRSGKS